MKSSLLEILAALSLTNSRKEKENILKTNKDNEDLKAVFQYAYDPRKKYYLRKVCVPEQFGEDTLTVEKIKAIFDPLDNRDVTGHAALDHWYAKTGSLDKFSYCLAKAMLEGDLDSGVNISTINKTWKDLIYVQPYMRCCLPSHIDMDALDWKNGIYVQLKEDGMWGEINSSYVTSRAGNRFDDEYTKAIQQDAINAGLGRYALNGEFLIEEDGVIQPREVGNGIMNSISKGGSLAPNQKLVYSAWDIVDTEGDHRKYEERFEHLQKFVQGTSTIRLIEWEEVHSKEEAWAFYRKQLSMNKEGAVIKTKTGEWLNGTSKDQIKLKITAELDLEVTGFKPGNGRLASTFGSISVKSACGELVCNVSGITDKERKRIHEMRDTMIGKIITVKANGIMRNGDPSGKHSLFLCRFLEVREDKTVADDFTRIEEIFQSLMDGEEA